MEQKLVNRGRWHLSMAKFNIYNSPDLRKPRINFREEAFYNFHEGEARNFTGNAGQNIQ